MRTGACEQSAVIQGFQARLRLARKTAGYERAKDFARAKGWTYSTYAGYEGDRTPQLDMAIKLASDLACSLDWLLLGRGSLRPTGVTLPIAGSVGAGARVDMKDDAEAIVEGEWVQLPRPSEAEALIVKGSSMHPRFLAGEIVLFDPTPLLPAKQVNRYAIVEFEDGSKKIKILRAGRREGLWRLDSHNADPEEDVLLRCAYRYLGVLSPPERAAAVPDAIRKRQ